MQEEPELDVGQLPGGLRPVRTQVRGQQHPLPGLGGHGGMLQEPRIHEHLLCKGRKSSEEGQLRVQQMMQYMALW